MPPYRPQTALVLGGIRSGTPEFAASLLSDALSVRHVVIGRRDDPAPSRLGERSARWTLEKVAPSALVALIAGAGPEDTVLVDDLGGWLTALGDELPTRDPAPSESAAVDSDGAVAALVDAVAGTRARIVIVSPEVGLAATPAADSGRFFADVVGSANLALAATCDGVVLVIAGQPAWLKQDKHRRTMPAVDSTVFALGLAIPVPAFAVVETPGFGGAADPDDDPPVRVGMTLPLPDDTAAGAAEARVAALPMAGAGLGGLAPVVRFVAGARADERPGPFASIRVVTVYGTHTGAIATGEDDATWRERLAAAQRGEGPLAHLAAQIGATIEIVDAGTARAIEDGDACDESDIEVALHRGWQIAQGAADRGDDLIVLAAAGPGLDAAAAGTVAAISRTEITSLLGRVRAPGGVIDDRAWMTRCLTIRDTLLRVRSRMSDGPHSLVTFGGPAIALATGLLLGAADRRTPVLIDGPVGAAALMAARDYASQVRLWCLLVDHGNHPTVRTAADILGLVPVFDLRMGLGEGLSALAVLPLLQSALTLSTMDSVSA